MAVGHAKSDAIARPRARTVKDGRLIVHIRLQSGDAKGYQRKRYLMTKFQASLKSRVLTRLHPRTFLPFLLALAAQSEGPVSLMSKTMFLVIITEFISAF